VKMKESLNMEKTSMNSIPKVSIILPGWNEAENIGSCINSIQKQNYDSFNVYMILGGDDTAYVEKARDLKWDRLIVLNQIEPNKMKAYNSVMNQPGLGDILIFSDMDCEFPRDFIACYVDAFKNKNKNIITGRVRPNPSSKGFIDRYHRRFEEKIAPDKQKIIHAVVGANFAMRKSFFFHKVRQFDESVTVGTDHVIAQRFKEIGEPIHFDPRLVVDTQMFSAGIPKYIEQQSRWIRIRVLRNRRTNHKAFRQGIMSLLYAWLMVFIFPLGILLSKFYGIWPVWQILLLIWIALLGMAWKIRFKILRFRKDENEDNVSLVKDVAYALCLLPVHYGIRVLSSLQLIFGKDKVEKRLPSF